MNCLPWMSLDSLCGSLPAVNQWMRSDPRFGMTRLVLGGPIGDVSLVRVTFVSISRACWRQFNEKSRVAALLFLVLGGVTLVTLPPANVAFETKTTGRSINDSQRRIPALDRQAPDCAGILTTPPQAAASRQVRSTKASSNWVEMVVPSEPSSPHTTSVPLHADRAPPKLLTNAL